MSRQPWTTTEIAILRQHYAAGGLDECMPLLPNRTRPAAYLKATSLKLQTSVKANVRGEWRTTPRVDALIREVHSKTPTRGDIEKLAKRIGYPRWWVSRRAREMSLKTPRFRELDWSEAEIELLHETAHLCAARARDRFVAAGFRRSETSIHVKRVRLSLNATVNGYYSMHQVAELLGVDPATIKRWGICSQKQEHKNQYLIHELTLREFIIKSPFRIDLRKVPPPNTAWFIELISGRSYSKKELKAA